MTERGKKSGELYTSIGKYLSSKWETAKLTISLKGRWNYYGKGVPRRNCSAAKLFLGEGER